MKKVLALVIVLLAGGANAHDAMKTAAAPLGWKYPWACCSNMDCRAVAVPADIREPTTIHPSYMIVKTGELIGQTDKRIKDSPDGEYHWCAHTSGKDIDHTICLFVPPKGF